MSQIRLQFFRTTWKRCLLCILLASGILTFRADAWRLLPSHEWTFGPPGMGKCGLREWPHYYHSSATPSSFPSAGTTTEVIVNDRTLFTLPARIEIVAGGFGAGLLALGIGGAVTIRGARNRQLDSLRTEDSIKMPVQIHDSFRRQQSVLLPFVLLFLFAFPADASSYEVVPDHDWTVGQTGCDLRIQGVAGFFWEWVESPAPRRRKC